MEVIKWDKDTIKVLPSLFKVLQSTLSSSQGAAYAVMDEGKLNIFAHYEGTNVLAILPFAHIYGLVIELLLPLCAGAITNIIIYYGIIKNLKYIPNNFKTLSFHCNEKIELGLEYIKKDDLNNDK